MAQNLALNTAPCRTPEMTENEKLTASFHLQTLNMFEYQYMRTFCSQTVDRQLKESDQFLAELHGQKDRKTHD